MREFLHENFAEQMVILLNCPKQWRKQGGYWGYLPPGIYLESWRQENFRNQKLEYKDNVFTKF